MVRLPVLNTRAGHLILIMEDTIDFQRLGDERIALQSMDARHVGLHLYGYVSVLLLSHLTGLSFEKAVSVLSELGSTPPNELVRFISFKLLAYSATCRGDMQESTWNVQKDQTTR